jgi:uncharacterized repeat protein (TIGR01451 family)
VFDQEGLSFLTLKDYNLVIWDDLSYQMSGLGDNDVSIFHRLFEVGVPLYFIGDDLAYSVVNLSPSRQADWIGLLHLNPGENLGGGNWLAIVEPNHPVINGPFGRVTEMAIGEDPDKAARTAAGETVLGQAGGSDVLLAYESPGDPTWTVTQNFLATAGGDPENHRRLFQNAVYWLTHGLFTPPADLAVEKSAREATSRLGDPVTFTITVANLGPATAAEVTVVDDPPAGLEKTGVSATAGSWSEENTRLVWRVGELPAGATATMVVEGVARELGWLTNTVTVASPAPDFNPANNAGIAAVLITPPPTIRISSIRVEGGKVYVEWTGDRGQLQRCADLAEPAWEEVGAAMATGWVGTATGRAAFYRVVSSP